jgi:quercetin dioxygenase-like cupin family protein
MRIFGKKWGYGLAALAIVAAILSVRSDRAADLNPAALSYKLPDQIHWTVDTATGSSTAVLKGDPNKEGLYIVLYKWEPHHMSHPHFHPHDRYITVLSGTWWVGTGAKFDPDTTVAMPAGSFVTHYAKQIHYDGAKDQEALLEIVGEGPATPTPAEQK